MMLKNTLSLALGVIIGATLGFLINDEAKKKIKSKICEKAKDLRNGYEGVIQEGKSKIKNEVQERFSS